MKVVIRPLKEEDAFVSVDWRNDPEVFRYTVNVYDRHISIESELDWIRKVINATNEYRCAIISDGVYVGNIYLTDITNDSAEFQIFIGNKKYWGKGVAKLASQLILRHAFENLKLEKVRLNVRISNERALLLYHSLGFNEIYRDQNLIRMEISSNNIK